ncbi:Detected protein of unknown function [Hibiscus syriacus]|uniref:Uncharacterized protein n=1 Tax=Hibiscus syriacus TaxID=106335 RepID=A0A6A2XTA1_HIBSY|nr:uncharacterized protein LOC120171136 [Hibiscus syriacus]KAE8673090.1 Detected protein of unknown function [Hibiscus syriacus]
MSVFPFASTTVVKNKTQFSSLLLSNFLLSCSYIVNNPLYFSYFIFFSPYLFKIFTFLSPLFVTTSLLVLAFFTVLRSEVVEDESDGLPCLEELEAYKIVFETSTIVEIRENPDEVLETEATVDCLQAVEELDEALVHNPETLTSRTTLDEELAEISRPVTVQVNAEVKIFEEFLQEKDGDGKDEESKAMGSKISDPKVTMDARNGEEVGGKAMVSSQRVKAADYVDNYINNETTASSFGNLGSLRREKEWKRTLACKLFEERHNAKAATVDGGGEGMDLLWETYESNGSTKSKLKSFGSWKKGKKGGHGIEDEDDEDYEEESDGHLCCLQALKFSTGKMNLGMRPNFVKISKALKGFGWLHHVGIPKHTKKGYY